MSLMCKMAGKPRGSVEVESVLVGHNAVGQARPERRSAVVTEEVVSAEIMRRVVRATYLGKGPGVVSDTGLTLSMVQSQYRHARSVASPLEHPAAVKAVAEAT